MDLYHQQNKSENILMAEKDLSVLRDLFHTLNDAGISLSSLNSSIALLEKYIENERISIISQENWPDVNFHEPVVRFSKVWKNNSRTFAYPMG
jgi:hypothetical protein